MEIGTISTLADGGNKIALYTPELNPADSTTLFEFAKTKTAFMVLARNDIKSVDVPEVLPEIEGEESESSRLRKSLWVLWDTEGRKTPTFSQFYRAYMEKIIDSVKSKLPPRL